MAKRPPHDRLVLVPYEPGRKLRQRLTAWLAVLIGMAGGFLIGAAGFYLRYQDFLTEQREVEVALAESRQQEAAFRQQVINLERGRTIDQLAAQDVQRTIHQLEETVARLKEDTIFYKNILAPAEGSKGLKVQKWEVEPLRERRYRYKLVLAQMADNKTSVEGVVAVNIIGLRGGEPEIIPLRDLANLRDLGIKFGFRYFQELTGELSVPEDFQPERVQVVVQSKGKKAAKFEQTFTWKRELSGRRTLNPGSSINEASERKTSTQEEQQTHVGKEEA